MTRRLASQQDDELTEAERDIRSKLGGRPFDFAAMAAVSNIYRAATTVRNHMEAAVLQDENLSWAAFTVLWVLWIWGEQEARQVASEAGLTKGTLTGVLNTLEKRSFTQRRVHPDDARRVLVKLAPAGRRTIERLFPRFNAEEVAVVSGLTDAERADLAHILRKITAQLSGADPA